jgi:Uma2 family endonuclease
MVMALKLPMPRYTTDDLRAFPPDGCRYELLDGLLIVTPAPGSIHQVVLSRVFGELLLYLGRDGPAVAVSPGEIEIAPSVLLDPDVLVLPARFADGTKWTKMSGWWLAVEVSGRASRRYDRDYKRDVYLALGVREFWLVDLEEQCVLVSRQGTTRDTRYATRLTWHPPEMAEPLVVDVARLFRGFP